MSHCESLEEHGRIPKWAIFLVIAAVIIVCGIISALTRPVAETPASPVQAQAASSAAHTESPEGGINWSGCKVMVTRPDGTFAHCPTAELGFRRDGVLMRRYRADWSPQ